MLATASAHGAFYNKNKRASSSVEFFTAKRYDEVAILPVFSLGAPTGMVSSWGSASIAVGTLATETVGAKRADASASMSMGLGNPNTSIGSTVSLSIGSVNPDGGMAERGSFGVSIGKFFTKYQFGVAVGGIDVAGWNDITTKRDHSVYVAATKILPFDKHPVIVSLGAGNNAFADVQTTAPDPKDETEPFLAVAYYLSPHINLIVDQTAGVLSLGTSIVPVAKWPLVITLGAYDINEDVPGTTSVSFTGSIAYSFTF